MSLTHPEGKSKAKLFRRWGFNETNIVQLREEFRRIAQRQKIVNSRISRDGSGKNYVVDGKMRTPEGKVKKIRTIWFVGKNQKNPIFVTAYPLK